MFNMEYAFEEIGLRIGAAEVALFSGTATLDNDPGFGDRSSYGFTVTGITLDGAAPNDWRDKRSIDIHAKHDDPFCRALFEKLAEALCNSSDAREAFFEELADHQMAA